MLGLETRLTRYDEATTPILVDFASFHPAKQRVFPSTMADLNTFFTPATTRSKPNQVTTDKKLSSKCDCGWQECPDFTEQIDELILPNNEKHVR